MIRLLDALCSSWMIYIPALAVVILLMAWLLMSNFFKTDRSNSVFRTAVMVLVPGCIVLFIYLSGTVYGLGYVNTFSGMLHSPKWICLTSEGTFGMHAKGGGRNLANRLYVVDPSDGHRVSRTVLGDFTKLIRLKGDTLFYKSGPNAFVLYDVSKCAIITTLNTETLPQQVRELSSGVESCDYDKEMQVIKATAKNGQTYYLDPYTLKTQTVAPVLPVVQKLHFDRDRIQLDSAHYLNLKSKNDDEKLFQLVDKSGKTVYGDTTWLYAEFLAHTANPNQFLILSYETTDKTNFIITGFSGDYKLLWKIKQSDLGASDFFTRKNETGLHGYASSIDFPRTEGNSLLFTIAGFVFSADMTTGKINWKTRL
jgi:hypothetical protein